MSQLHVLDHTGDTVLDWTPSDKNSVAKARKEFNEKVKAGYTAFAANKKIDKFDPSLGKIVLTPPVKGGYPQSV